MIIQVDKEGRRVIEQLCDIALKMNLNSVNLILRSVKPYVPTPEELVALKEQLQPKSPEKNTENPDEKVVEKKKAGVKKKK